MPIETTIDTISKANDELMGKVKQSAETGQQQAANSLTALTDFLDGTLHANLQLSERLANHSRARIETSLQLGQSWSSGKALAPDAGLTEETKEGLNKLMEADRALYQDLSQWWKAGQDRQLALSRELVEAQFRALKAGLVSFESLAQYGETLLGEWQKSASEFIDAAFSGKAVFSGNGSGL